MDNKEARRAARKAHVTALKVGDILVASWGYDQTNIDYFEVTRVVSGKTVEVREIAQRVVESKGFMTETVVPVPGQYIGAVTQHRVTVYDNIKLNSYKYATKWDGQPDFQSHYA